MNTRDYTEIQQSFSDFIIRHETDTGPNEVRVNFLRINNFLREHKELTGKREFYSATPEELKRWILKFQTDPEWRKGDKASIEKLIAFAKLFLEFLEQKGIEDSINVNEEAETILIPEESEGESREWHVTRYERNRRARDLCIKAYGNKYECAVCGMNFENKYGPTESGKPYIEIHHIIGHAERSKIKGKHPVNFATELIPLCANCHRMVHYLKKETLHPEKLKEILNKR